jgi:hypothetical protein
MVALWLFVAVLVQHRTDRASAVEPKPDRWTPALMLQTRRIGHVRPSPDGQRVVYTVTEPVMTDNRSEFVSQIWLANADGSESRGDSPT